jgi:Flp pilus assembly protein TadB
MITDILVRFGRGLEPFLPFLLALAVLLVILLSGSSLLAGLPTRRSKKALAGKSSKSKVKEFFARSRRAGERDSAEFEAVVGMSRGFYRIRTALIAGAAAVVFYLLTGSFVPAFWAFYFMANFLHGRVAGKLTASRNAALDHELLRYAPHISRMLESGMPLGQSLASIARPDPETPVKRAIKRALAPGRHMPAALAEEAEFAHQEAIRDFFDLLAEGSSSVQRQATTKAALERYTELNLKKRTGFRRTLAMTGQIRSTRNFLLLLIPGMYVVTLLNIGPETMFGTTVGEILTFVIFGAIALAVYLSNFVIRLSMKGY